MFLTYLVHKGVGNHRQYGALSSSIAMFLNANCAALIICCGSLLGSKVPSRQPNLVSKATRPMHSNDHLWISLAKSFGSSLFSSSSSDRHRVMKSSVTFSSGFTYRRTVDSCKTGFWTRERNSFHFSPCTPTTPGRSPKKSLRNSLLYFTKLLVEKVKYFRIYRGSTFILHLGMDGRNGVGPSFR